MLKGKTAVITGASRGIGQKIAEVFAKNGANVAVLDISGKEAAEEYLSELSSEYGITAKFYQADVSSMESAKSVIKEITDDFSGFDILVNNAGITRDNLIATMSEEEFDAVINVNLKGTFNMTKASTRNFIKRKYGKIINIASVSGISGIAGQANYSASKAGIIALTKVTAKELGSRNICANAIAPGFIMTDMTKDLGTDEEFLKSIPLKRLGKPEDVANLALFLASPLSDYISGEVIRADGGLLM